MSIIDHVSIPSTLDPATAPIQMPNREEMQEQRLIESRQERVACPACGHLAVRERVTVHRPGQPSVIQVLLRCKRLRQVDAYGRSRQRCADVVLSEVPLESALQCPGPELAAPPAMRSKKPAPTRPASRRGGDSTAAPPPVNLKRVEVLRALYRLSRELGQPPTLRELSDALAGRAMATLFYHLRVLRSHGLVDGQDRAVRTWRITEAGLRALGLEASVGSIVDLLTQAREQLAILDQERIDHPWSGFVLALAEMAEDLKGAHSA